MLDQERLRRDTSHLDGQVFLDSAGSSLAPDVVVNTVIEHLRREAEVGGYRAADERIRDLEQVKASIGVLIGAASDAIALSDSATRSWTDLWCAVPLCSRDRVLLSEAEYVSNAIAVLHRAKSVGAQVEVIPSDGCGQIDLDVLERMLDERVRIVSVVHVPTNGGLVNPVAEVIKLAHEVGAFVLLDACQSVGQLPLDVTELGVDALTGTGRKWLRGPRGTGFSYIRPDWLELIQPAVLAKHSAQWTGTDTYLPASDATRFEFWEFDVAARLGLGAAVDYLITLGPSEVYAAVAARAQYLRDALTTLPGVTVRDIGEIRSGIISFTVDGMDSADVRDRLRTHSITVTVSTRGSTRLDMTRRGLESVVRASPHYFNSYDDIDRAVDAIASLGR